MLVSRLALVSLVLVTACGPSAPQVKAPPPVKKDTALGAGDIFEVRIYGEEQLSGTYQVADDGTINFPFVGQVKVGGMDPPKVANVLAERLEKENYLRDPQISIFVKESRSKQISVVGAVSSPGSIQMRAGMTVVQAISMAGGLSSLASADSTVVTRRVDGEIKRFQVPVSEIQQGEAEDIPLQAGDIVYVPERLF